MTDVVCVLNNKIGFIGYGNQALRIEKILKKLDYKISYIFKPNIIKKSSKYTNNLENIDNCDVIFICSPNVSHFKYLRKLIGKKYIFCEKPPVSNYNQLLALKKIINKKVFFNYNLRFSEISNLIKKYKKLNFGKLLNANIILTHGLSSKKNYYKNWRSKKDLSPKGVFETVAIHAIDMISYNFNVKKLIFNNLVNTSNKGTSYDTSFTNLITNENANINIFTSYNAPLVNSWNFVFENGIINYESNQIKISGPKINLDNQNNFIEPKILFLKKIKYKKIYEDSLYNSVKYFMDKIQNKGFFDYELSLFSNSLIVKK